MKYYDYSRLSVFKRCPRLHHYLYEECIQFSKSKPLLLGSMFHECIELYYTGRDPKPVLDEYRRLVMNGTIDNKDPDLMEYMLNMYSNYYAVDDMHESTLLVEYRFEEKLAKGEIFHGTIDKVVELDSGLHVLRDTKTTSGPLKYNDIRYNGQLNIYIPYAEDKLKVVIDAIQIDEVRLARLEQVPLIKSGKPTIDKKRLELVTYEDYESVLDSQGLRGDPTYMDTLEYLEKRGHPLFRRSQAQVDKFIVEENRIDFAKTYKTCKTNTNYRINGQHCDWCPAQELCKLDYHSPTPKERELCVQRSGGKL